MTTMTVGIIGLVLFVTVVMIGEIYDFTEKRKWEKYLDELVDSGEYEEFVIYDWEEL